jgi:hypothetical protein
VQCKEAHECRQGRVIQTPPGQQTGGEAETLVAGEDCLWIDEYDVVNQRWAVGRYGATRVWEREGLAYFCQSISER